MREEYAIRIEKALDTVPNGTFAIERHGTQDAHSAHMVEQFTTQTEGKGKIESYPLFAGIEIRLHRYLAEQVRFHHVAKDFVLEVNHCRTGRIGWNMCDGASVYLGPGDLCVHSNASCADSEMSLPLGCYEGMAVMIDLHRLKMDCPALLREAGLDAEKLYRKFCAGKRPIGIPASSAIDAIFAPLYDLSASVRIPYYKLKAQELLLYLMQWEALPEDELIQYGAEKTELIKEIRHFLVQHLDQRFTIEALSKKYLINTSSLKAVFKAVYGMPIAAYVKEYRMQQAMRLLRETDDSIATIAAQVGYETQGKFTKAFKASVQMLPTEYRKLYRKEPLHP